MVRLPEDPDPRARRARLIAEHSAYLFLEQQRREAAIFQASVLLHSKKLTDQAKKKLAIERRK